MLELFQFLSIPILVFLNGFFVAAEFSLVAIRRTRISELVKAGNKQARLVEKSLEDIDAYISATQLGITVASLALGWVGEPALAHYLEPILSFLPEKIMIISAHSLAVIIGFSLITFLHIVLGEIVPKTISLQRAEPTVLSIIWPLRLFYKIFKPFIWLLDNSGSLFLKIFGLGSASEHQSVHSEEEIKMILSQSRRGGVIEKEEVEMVNNVFRLSDLPVKQIMIPRTNVVAFNVDTPIKIVIKKIESLHLYSRFPVYSKSLDHITGFVHIKDIYKAALSKKETMSIKEANLVREAIAVPETNKVDDVLLEMRKQHIHIAIVQDEYGGTAGIVTLENIIESLVGEIEDEFDTPSRMIQKLNQHSYAVNARTSISKVNDVFNTNFNNKDYDTIGGLVFGQIGREPEIGETLELSGLLIEVKEIENSVPKKLLIKIPSTNSK